MPKNEPREVELKLAVSAEAMAEVATLPWLAERAEGRPRTLRLISTYFDTLDLDLLRRGISLRVREVARRRIQTLKTAREPGLPVGGRGEWEVDVPSARPDLAAFDDPRVAELMGGVATTELQPVFQTRIRRRVIGLHWPSGSGDAHIELALDQGEVVVGRVRRPVCEIELELFGGPAEALLALAAALRAAVPLRISRIDKAAVGYRLAAGVPLRFEKAVKLRMERDWTVEAAMQATLRGCLGHALANEAPARDGQLEGVHQLRVALRRLRSALSIFAPVLPEAQRLRWRGEARWLLGALARCRDLDVFLYELLTAPDDTASGELDLGSLREVAAQQREQALAALQEALASQRAGDFLLDLACWIERCGWREPPDEALVAARHQPIVSYAADVLGRRFRRLRKAGRGFAGLDPPARHEVRIQAKKLRYGIEFFAAVLDRSRVKEHLAALTRLLDLLGRRNDVAVARHLVVDLIDAGPADEIVRMRLARAGGELVGWHAHAVAVMEVETRRAWRRVKALDPAKLIGE